MAGWFRQGPSPHQTALAMIGAKTGNRIVFVGATDPDLAAEVARITGLNGQTTVVDQRAETQTAVDAAAAHAGTLIEFQASPLTTLPIDASDRDITVLVTPLATLTETDRAAVVYQALRVLRPGGRVIVIDGTRRPGLLSGLQSKSPRVSSEVMLALLQQAGARASRLLAESEGVAYYEARKNA